MKLKLASILLLICLMQPAGMIYSQQTEMTVDYTSMNKPNSDDDLLIAFNAFVLAIAINPVLVYENKKFYFGLTREVTLGFGKIAQYRLSAEYSFIFRPNMNHNIRISAKYDLLSRLSKSTWFPSRDAFSIGTGFFWDAGGNGIFPEITAGYRFDESDIIIYPYAKLRHTFMLTKNKPDITDLSLGMILGFKPF